MTLMWYLTRLFALRIGAAAAVLLLLALGIDLIRTADDLIGLGGGPALARYGLLRSPGLLASVLPVAILVGGLTAALALADRAEIVVMRASGLSSLGLGAKLLPLAAVLGVLHHGLIDRWGALADQALTRAFPALAETPQAVVGDRVAGRQGGEVVIATLARADGTELAPVAIYRLDPSGRIEARLSAASARFIAGVWHLDRITPDAAQGPDPAIWRTGLDPAAVLALASGARPADAAESAAALAGTIVASRSTAYYASRIARAQAAFALPATMLLIALLASLGPPRGPGRLRLAGLGLALGLVYVLTGGLGTSLAEAGILGATVGAWLPTGLFAAGAIWALVMIEERA